MTKVTSKLLTLFLSFAMVFTSIGWLGADIVNASGTTGTLYLKVQDSNGDPATDARLYLDPKNADEDVYEGTDIVDLDPPDSETGIIQIKGDEVYESYGDGVVFYVNDSNQIIFRLQDENTETAPVQVVLNVEEQSFTFDLIDGKGNSADNPYIYTISASEQPDPAGGDDPAPSDSLPAVEDFNKVDANVWPLYGISYDKIDFSTDYIVDVRHTDSSVTSTSPFIDFSKDPHFVNTDQKCVDVTGAEVAEGSAQAKKLDDFYKAAEEDGKRIVIICYGGMTMAKRAMQYYNSKHYNLGPEGDVTYLIGGSNGVLKGEYKLNLGIGASEIDAYNDVILDVRSSGGTKGDDFGKGHRAGAINADLYNNTAEAVKGTLDAALNSVPEGGKLVIVCYSGKGLAEKAMTYYKKNAGENLKKVSYVIGGAGADTSYGIFTGEEKARTMEVNIDMSKYPKGETVRVWIPVPQDKSVKGYEYQSISGEEFWANKAKEAKFTTITSGEFTNKMLYIEWDANTEPSDRTAALKFDAKRVLVSNNGIKATADPFPEEVKEYITKESEYVKVNADIVKQTAAAITEGKTDSYDKAKAIYEWVIANLERIDNGETLTNADGKTQTFEVIGCGYGDTVKILNDQKNFGRAGGHCTDINSTFVALCRAAGIPAREMFGIRMNDDATGGQHCWAEFYQPGTGWVFADPGDVLKKAKGDTKNMTLDQLKAARESEAVKKITNELWGGVDNNRVVLSRGRDLTLEPAQSSTNPVYNTFGYPCAEHNGQRIECTDAKNFVYTISSKAYGSPITPAPAQEPELKAGEKFKVSGNTYKVTSVKSKTAAFVKAKNKKSVSVPATVKYKGKTLKVTQVNAGAFKGKKIRTVTIGKNVKKIAKNAFKGSKATKMIVKTKKLKKASVKGALKGSKIKTVQVKVGKKSVNKKYVKKYKKIFTKKNAGKKVKVK